MKNTTLTYILLLISLFLFSCEKMDIPESSEKTEQPSSSCQKVKIHTRASSYGIPLTYPIEVCAFNEDEELVASQIINDDSEQLQLSLPKGDYKLVALSGSTDFSNGYSDTPLLKGTCQLSVNTSSVTCNIVLSPAVAKLSIILNNVPADVTTASVRVSPQYKSVTTLGDFEGSTTISIPFASSNAGTWSTGQIYVLPGAEKSTSFTIAINSPSGEVTSGVTLGSPLLAGTPYNFLGSYTAEAQDMLVTGTLSTLEWNTPVTGSFDFGPQATSNTIDVGSVEQIHVDELPQVGTIWEGHVIAYIDGNDALLYSLKQENNVTSAYYEADPYVASIIASNYNESGLTGWKIPTKDQAHLLRTLWSGSKISSLSKAIEDAGGDPLSIVNSKDENNRFLCEGATYTYSFADNAGITAAGKTVKTYCLRLVKQVQFVTQ